MPRRTYRPDEVFFTSDLHLGHKNILKYAGRPFTTTEAMRAEMISRWNKVVPPSATVYVLGDIYPGNKAISFEFFAQVNGEIRVLKGNHDRTQNLRWLANTGRIVQGGYAAPGFWRSYEEIKIEGPGVSQILVLSHFPLRTWNQMHHGSWHLHGHSHSRAPEGRSPIWSEPRCDVGVDAWDYTPVSWEQLVEHFARYVSGGRNDR